MTATTGEERITGSLRPLGYFDYIKREGMSSTAASSRNGAEKPATPNEGNGPAPNSQEDSRAETAKYNHLIDAFNQLQAKMAACGHRLDPKLPKIAVIGPENSGKSSVLQSFVGKDFLPNGSGLVTRRPTVIQLEPLPKGSEEYGVFAHMTQDNDNKEMKIYDFAAIRQEILDETNRLLGPTEFSSEPIVLKIYSPHVLKLTLVDLPGMVECEVDDQDESVVTNVMQMVRENIADPATILLAVCPANQPIATSVALRVAKEVDPNRERTIGVLTKLDLEEAGTNSLEILDNKKLPLQRGYVGVINRSQTDILEGRDREYEREFEKTFIENSCYKFLAGRMGTDYLQEMLQKTLKQHIQKQLPTIREDLSLRLARMQRELKTFNETVGGSVDEEGSNFYLMNYVHDFVKKVNVDLMGYSDEVPDSTLSTGAELNAILNFEAQKFLRLDTTPDERDLTCIMASLCGIRNNISLPSLSMNAMCRKLVGRFIDPLETSLLTVRDVLLDSVLEQTSCMDRYPSLKNEVICMIKSKITQLTEETREKLVDHCMAEQLSVNIGHPDYDTDKCSSIAPQASCTKVWEKVGKGGEPQAAVNGVSRPSYSKALSGAAARPQPKATAVTLSTASKDELLMECYNSLKNKMISQGSRKWNNFCESKILPDLHGDLNELVDQLSVKLSTNCQPNMAEQLSVNIGHPEYDSDKRSSIAPQASCTKVLEKVGKGGQPETAENGAAALAHPKATATRDELLMECYNSLKNKVISQGSRKWNNFFESKILPDLHGDLSKLVDRCMAEQLSVNIGHPDYDTDKSSSIVPQASCTKVLEKVGKGDQPQTAENGVPRPSYSTAPSGGAALAQPKATAVAQYTATRDELLSLLMEDECNKRRTQFVSQMIINYLEIVKKNVSHVYFINIKYFLVFKFLDYLDKRFKIELGTSWASNLKKTLAADCEEDFKRKAEMEAKCKYLEEALALVKAF